MPSVSRSILCSWYTTNEISSQPVYGLIFLYRYQEDEQEEDEEMKDLPPCSSHVWFANQVCSRATQERLKLINSRQSLMLAQLSLL